MSNMPYGTNEERRAILVQRTKDLMGLAGIDTNEPIKEAKTIGEHIQALSNYDRWKEFAEKAGHLGDDLSKKYGWEISFMLLGSDSWLETVGGEDAIRAWLIDDINDKPVTDTTSQ